MISTTQTFDLKTRKPKQTDVIDEDALLNEEDLAQKVVAPGSDCSTARRACKNCSCGRAELEAEQGQAMPANPSACGNCSRGDAFRCAGCPYRGKPAWTPGETVALNQLDDDEI
eukprot:NODE_5326_length_690_cov_39.021841_g4952_i0.p1 GENE.NODE_5326_length_690_cov_39.021841_g4952_i0~~NODE_5326_length_690_cov_39.021841_g4952_i0.p1  ORF type:complete len:114 (-),score=21.76 NODE_5326_length_690_cov_39.021841_g4952_i0:270-611(-)